MRLRDFLRESSDIYIEESGMRICVGLGGYEQLGENYFGWRQGEPFQTAEVSIDLHSSSEMPIESARKIIGKLGLPLDKGTTASRLIEAFGTPQIHKPGRVGTHFLRFICGKEEQYLLGCFVDDREGLNSFFLARKDYYDQAEAI